jgi:hypothetical protein
VICFEPAQLMRLQQEQRGLDSGKKRRTKDQNGDTAEDNRQSDGTHVPRSEFRVLWVAFPARMAGIGGRRSPEELMVRGLLIL